MALFSKRNLKRNPYDISEKDMIGDLRGFPVGVVVKMMEEQERQGNTPNVHAFQKHIAGIVDCFDWECTFEGLIFWSEVINKRNFSIFFEKYPEYTRYNLD